MNQKRNSGPVGVITGTGVTEHFEFGEKERIKTEYGVTEVYPGPERSFLLLPRHGLIHGTPPHRVNYRANISALYSLGVRKVIASSAVGSMNPKFKVGQLGVASQFIDFTKRRQDTFFDDTVRHTDMTNPYSLSINAAIGRAAERLGIPVHQGLVYVCLEGPRFETAAEIRMLRKFGGDVVGMTGIPEVVLAKELGIEYSSVLVATNWAAGIQPRVSHEEVLEEMKKVGPKVKSLIVATARDVGD